MERPQTEEERVELIRRFYDEGWLDTDFDSIVPHLDPDVELVNPEDAVRAGTRKGLDEVVAVRQGLVEALESSRYELRTAEAHGETVVAEVAHSTIVRGSELRVEQAEAHTWTFREGRIIRIEWGRDISAARRAAGLDG
jgi:ketosteroid isomerase-like protein